MHELTGRDAETERIRGERCERDRKSGTRTSMQNASLRKCQGQPSHGLQPGESLGREIPIKCRCLFWPQRESGCLEAAHAFILQTESLSDT